MMPRDGVEPPTPAFSGLLKTAKSVISSNPQEYKGTRGNAKEPLLFLCCSFATRDGHRPEVRAECGPDRTFTGNLGELSPRAGLDVKARRCCAPRIARLSLHSLPPCARDYAPARCRRHLPASDSQGTA